MTAHQKIGPFTLQSLGFLSFALVCMIAASLYIGFRVVETIESETRRTVENLMPVRDIGWVSPSYDGLEIHLAGQATDEHAKSRVLEAIGSEINISRVVDNIQPPIVETSRPDIVVEIVQNDDIASILGVMPRDPSPRPLYRAIERANPAIQPLNLVQSTNAEADPTWEEQIAFLATLIETYPNIKISATPNQAQIKMVAANKDEAQALRDDILEIAPSDVVVDLDIVAPRPLIVPFEFVVERRKGEYDVKTCSATTGLEARKIAAAIDLDPNEAVQTCQLGLGSPTDNWGLFVESVLMETDDIDDFELRLVDNQVVFSYASDTDPKIAEDSISTLRGMLPPGFGLETSSFLTKQSIAELQAGGGDLELVMSKEEGGMVEITGVVPSEIALNSLQSYGAAIFGSQEINYELEIVEGLNPAWEANAFAGMNALKELTYGKVISGEQLVAITGETTSTHSAQTLEEALRNETQGVEIAVDVMALTDGPDDGTNGVDVAADLNVSDIADVTDIADEIAVEKCTSDIAIIVETQAISFEPSSTELTDSSRGTIDQIATLLKDCEPFAIEIAGHTDSQGSSEGNLKLSSDRADAVRTALLELLPDIEERLSAKGYGEEFPIADNDTQEGRATNRRIEFIAIEEANGDQNEPE